MYWGGDRNVKTYIYRISTLPLYLRYGVCSSQFTHVGGREQWGGGRTTIG